MTEQEYKNGIDYLIEEEIDVSPIESIKIGMWAMYDAGGNLTVSRSKKEAIDELLFHYMQIRKHCHVKRYYSGRYEVYVLDPDEDRERVWREHALEKITPENLDAFREMMLVDMLPDKYWY